MAASHQAATPHRAKIKHHVPGRNCATIRELAAWSGAHRQTVVRHLARAGVELRRLGLTGEQAQNARDLYVEGSTLVEIAARLSVAASTIRSCLLRQGVRLRTAARRRIA